MKYEFNVEKNFDLNNLVNEIRCLRDRLETALFSGTEKKPIY